MLQFPSLASVRQYCYPAKHTHLTLIGKSQDYNSFTQAAIISSTNTVRDTVPEGGHTVGGGNDLKIQMDMERLDLQDIQGMLQQR